VLIVVLCLSTTRAPNAALQRTQSAPLRSPLSFEPFGARRSRSGPAVGASPRDRRANPWLGIHLGLWKAHGTTPLWLVFSEKGAGRAQEVRSLFEPWAKSKDTLAASIGREFAVALEVPVGEEEAKVVQSLVNDLKAIAGVLVALPPRSLPNVEPESDGTLQ
jgi:hypothetical protein